MTSKGWSRNLYLSARDVKVVRMSDDEKWGLWVLVLVLGAMNLLVLLGLYT